MGTKTKKPPAKPAAKPKARPVSGADAPTPPRAPQPPGLVATPPPVDYYATLRTDEIRPSPFNPRKSFPGDGLRELADSIGTQGFVQRIIVRPLGDRPRMTPKGWEGVAGWELVDGERRLRAAKFAGLVTVPVTARVLTDEQALLQMLVANDQREDVRPSERAAAYAALAAAGQTAEQISAATGVALSAVRDLVRLARLPAWALAAVDAGTLPVTTAALVAKVPGEESRLKAAACVLLGFDSPADLRDGWGGNVARATPDPLSYRDAKALLATHFTTQLKGAPFSLKMADLLPAAGSCDGCPKRAGNDPEARADGVRADVCLDPDCYRSKVEAYKRVELLKAESKHRAQPVPEEFAWPPSGIEPPSGWVHLDDKPGLTAMRSEPWAAGVTLGDTLRKMLGQHCPQQYVAFNREGAVRLLARTGEVRKALVAAGKARKPERAKPAPKAERPGPTFPEVKAAADTIAAAGKPLVSKVAEWEVHGQAMEIAARVMGEYAEEQCSQLGELDDACANGPVVQALRLVTQAVAYDRLVDGGTDHARVLALRFPGLTGKLIDRDADENKLTEVGGWPAARCLAFLMQIAVSLECGDGPNTETANDLLDWAELDWPGLTDQARRVLAGGESAEEKLAGVEAAAKEPPFIQPGEHVRTSYGTGPYLVKHVGTVYEDGRAVCSLTLAAKGGKNAFLNDLHRQPDGRILRADSKDEVVVVPAGTDPGPSYRDWLKAAGLKDDNADGGPLRGAWMRGEPAPAIDGPPPPVPLADLDIPDVVLDLLGFLADQTVAGAWAGCLAGTEGLDALPPRNRLMAWLVKIGAKAKPADQAAKAIAAALPADAGKAGAA